MNKKKYGLLFKFGVIFLIFIILTLTATGIATYANQTQIYQEQQKHTLQNLARHKSIRNSRNIHFRIWRLILQ